MNIRNLLKTIIFVSFFHGTNVMAHQIYSCTVEEQTESLLEADYGYNFIKEQIIALSGPGSSMRPIGTNLVTPVIEIGTFHGIHFSVSYEKGIPRISSRVKGVLTQNQAAGYRATSIVTNGEWTVIVSCDKN